MVLVVPEVAGFVGYEGDEGGLDGAVRYVVFGDCR